MSDALKHECGIALIRLRKPLAYYQDQYGTSLYGFNKLFLLMEKQHNRGQDGVGVGCCKLDVPLGQSYLFRQRSSQKDSLATVFHDILEQFNHQFKQAGLDKENPDVVKRRFDFGGEILTGHLRYGTSGEFGEGSCHPYLRRSNWPTKTLMVLGNFNMTNASFLAKQLIDRGQHPVFGTDTQTVLEEIGFHLDEQHTDIYRELRDEGVSGRDIPRIISERLDLVKTIRDSAEIWDGGYTISGVVGNGDCFVLRDPHGIRPCFYYQTEDVIAFASERVPLMTAFDALKEDVTELEPGCVAVVKGDGTFTITRFADEVPHQKCSFERIYFSRGNDPDIYQERKALGGALVPQILAAVKNDLENTVLSFVPNTAETAYYGVMESLRLHRRVEVKEALLQAMKDGSLSEQKIDELILRNWPRGEKVAHKDIKLRTFIAEEKGRNQLVSHVYDITYGVVDDDYLVVIDDSIVRGTTLRKSILKILARTNPRKIVIVSTAPQIRYPDCYGIDMSELGKFIAFQATIDLHKQRGQTALINEVYLACLEEVKKPVGEMENCVKKLYDAFTPEEISAQISQLVYPQMTHWNGEVEVIFQSIENLKQALPKDCGVWYFTGDYPTPGGYSVANHAFIHFYEKRSGRVYDLLPV